MTTALRSRTTYLIAVLVTATLSVVAAINAPVASARVDPNGPYPYPATPLVATAGSGVAHTGSSTGLAIWLVVLIAVAALAVGAGLAELSRSVARTRRLQRPAVIAV